MLATQNLSREPEISACSGNMLTCDLSNQNMHFKQDSQVIGEIITFWETLTQDKKERDEFSGRQKEEALRR